MSSSKEPHFFSRDSMYAQGVESYQRLFAKSDDFIYRGESSTTYMVSISAVERIARHISDPRFIFVLRNPIDRAYSHYWWLRGLGFESRPFRCAVTDDMECDPDPNRSHRNSGNYLYYYQFGLYAKWLRMYINAFNKESVCVIFAEGLRSSPEDSLQTCFSFLG